MPYSSRASARPVVGHARRPGSARTRVSAWRCRVRPSRRAACVYLWLTKLSQSHPPRAMRTASRSSCTNFRTSHPFLMHVMYAWSRSRESSLSVHIKTACRARDRRAIQRASATGRPARRKRRSGRKGGSSLTPTARLVRQMRNRLTMPWRNLERATDTHCRRDWRGLPRPETSGPPLACALPTRRVETFQFGEPRGPPGAAPRPVPEGGVTRRD